ncbi:hypothetical protein [Ideonella sp. A 288]|uniref:hypothetical protein n=1 Tax=Ideonella sp. A 288 TaxID=1962181 RepID=UPI000B4B5200|nr:hypothetical protein [Ideonella sp. A 288]
MRTPLTLSLLALGLALSACGEKAQTTSARKSDGKAWEMAPNGYVAGGWKAGDQASWEQQMRQRAQAQNEYTRSAAQPK